MKKIIVLALFACIHLTLEASGISFSQNRSDITVNHPYFQCRIAVSGGKIISLIDQATQREFVNSANDIFGGIAKFQDAAIADAAPFVDEYQLSVVENSQDRLVIAAAWSGKNAGLAGIGVVRTYTFSTNSCYIGVTESLRAVSKEVKLHPRFHNSFSTSGIDTSDTWVSMKSHRGPVKFNVDQLCQKRIQAIIDPSASYLGFINTGRKTGLLVLFEKTEFLENLFAWGSPSEITLIGTFKAISLEPMAERDTWRTEYWIMPFQGEGEILSASKELIVSGGPEQICCFLPESVRSGELYVAGEGRNPSVQQLAAGKRLYCFSMDKNASIEKLNVGFNTPGEKYAVDILYRSKKVEALSRLPKQEVNGGVIGNYYYYPDMYLSRETNTWVSFGLRGDFTKKKNLLLVLLLPKEVEFKRSAPGALLRESEVEINGKTFRQYEMKAFRKSSYCNAMEVSLQLCSPLPKDSVGYVKAVWDGGEQKAEKFGLLEVGKFPDLGKGLALFTVGLEFRRGIHDTTFEKFGFNRLMLPMVSGEFGSNYKGDKFYASTVAEIRRRGMVETTNLGYPLYLLTKVMGGDAAARKDAGTLFHPTVNYQEIDFSRANAIDLDGKKASGSKNYMLICPAFRGRYYEKTIDMVKTAIDYGFDNITVDEETWAHGGSICFCDTCKTLFRERLEKAGLPIVDMKTVAAHPRKYPDHYRLWWDQKTDQLADIYRGIRETMDTYRPVQGVKRRLSVWVDFDVNPREKLYGSILHRLTDYRKLAKYADELIPMCYSANEAHITTVAGNGAEILRGTNAVLLMGLSPNRTYEYENILARNFAPLHGTEHQILESFFNGAKGVIFWSPTTGLRAALDFLNIANAVKRIQPIEEIVFQGRPVEVKTDNPEIQVTALQHNGKIAVFLRNYSGKKLQCRLQLPPGIRSVLDTFTGKTVVQPVFTFDDQTRIHTLELK